MSTQEIHAPDVPVTYTPNQSSLRLLELPPELCDLISSNKLNKLSFKSAAPQSRNSPAYHPISTTDPPPHAVLCTPTQTYQLRQVQTSNTVLVARPFIPAPTITNPSQLPGLFAFATCTSSLELTPMDNKSSSNAKTVSAEQWLNYLVPYYESFRDADSDIASHGKPRSKMDVFADVPFSDGECETAWLSLGAFELDKCAVKPSVKTLFQLWTLVFQSSDMAQPFIPTTLQDALTEADIPHALFDSVLAYLSPLSTPPGGAIYSNEPVQLDRDKTVTWVGQIHYANKIWHSTDQTRDPAAMTLDGWRALLPESWREDVTLERFTDLTYDRFKPPNARKDSIGPYGKADKSGSKRPGKSRDWHEKFKRTKTK